MKLMSSAYQDWCNIAGAQSARAPGGGAPSIADKGAGQGCPGAAHSSPYKAHSALNPHEHQHCCCQEATHEPSEVFLRAYVSHGTRATLLSSLVFAVPAALCLVQVLLSAQLNIGRMFWLCLSLPTHSTSLLAAEANSDSNHPWI